MLINIENLRLRTIIGIFEWEKKNLQDIVINVEMEVDCREPVLRDDISSTVDYKNLTKQIIGLIEGGKFGLLETVAGRVAEIALSDEKVRKVAVRVEKPGALRFADSVSVTYTDERRQ